MSNHVFIFSFKRQTGENHEKSYFATFYIFRTEYLAKSLKQKRFLKFYVYPPAPSPEISTINLI